MNNDFSVSVTSNFTPEWAPTEPQVSKLLGKIEGAGKTSVALKK